MTPATAVSVRRTTWWVGLTTAVTLLVSPLARPAAADTFLNPADPCPVAAPQAPFDDRDEIADVHVDNVDCIAALEITEGKQVDGDLLFLPQDETRRDWMASFIVRTLDAAGYDLPAPSDQGFGDIDDNVHADNIRILADIGVTKGTTASTFSPRRPVERDQMASFLVRAAVWAYEGEDGPGFTAQEPFPFDDVTNSNVHRDNIAVAAEILGLTTGATETTYEPSNGTTRQQMASFLIRLADMILNTG